MGPRPSPFEVDLNREQSHDYRSVQAIKRGSPTLTIGIAVAIFTLGMLLGFFLGLSRDVQPADEALPSPAYAPHLRIVPEAERTVERRLAAIAFGQAGSAVGHSIGQSRRLASIAARYDELPDEIPVLLNTNRPGVRVRVGGREVDPDEGSIYRVRRDQPFTLEFEAPIDDPWNVRDFHLSVTPLLEGIDIYDPYDPARRPQ
jgi:hypothetical protein